MPFIDGQQILIPDFNSITGTWGTRKASVHIQDTRFHIDYESGLTLWGTSAEYIQEMIDKAARVQKVNA